jgi:hypothetical protein
MEFDTVEGLINELVSTYSAVLDFYVTWQHQRWQNNHYYSRGKDTLSSNGACGLSTSLTLSCEKIKQAFESGAEILGDGFTRGDSKKKPTTCNS